MGMLDGLGVDNGREVDNSRRDAVLIVMCIFTALGMFAVGTRIYVRKHTMGKLGWDDYSILVAALSTIGYFTCIALATVNYGYALLKADVRPEWAIPLSKTIYAVPMIYSTALYAIKLSMVLFYIRMTAGITGRFNLLCRLTIAVITAFFVAQLVLSIAQCVPVAKNWDKQLPGYCMDKSTLYYPTTIFTIVTDLWVIGLPIPMIWQLRQPRAEKIAILAIFFTAIIATIASGVRLYVIKEFINSTENLYDGSRITMWSFIEINLGMICASAPAMKPLFKFKRRRIWYDFWNSGAESGPSSPSKTPSGSNTRIGDSHLESWRDMEMVITACEEKLTEVHDVRDLEMGLGSCSSEASSEIERSRDRKKDKGDDTAAGTGDVGLGVRVADEQQTERILC
jgi:hypothetical protein